MLGPGLGVLGVGLTALSQSTEEGNDVGTAIGETAVSLGFGAAGFIATGIFCASGVGTVACLAGGIAIGIAATEFGDKVGEAVVTPFGDFVSDVVSNAGDAIGDFFGDLGG